MVDVDMRKGVDVDGNDGYIITKVNELYTDELGSYYNKIRITHDQFETERRTEEDLEEMKF